jgi:diguanylate cyclase (GGDEF)-like protein
MTSGSAPARRMRDALRLTGTEDPALISRFLGALYIAGGLLVMLSLLLPHPEGTFKPGLWGIAVVALLIGSACILRAKHARLWSLHAILAIGTGLICLCVYFAGVAAGVYSAMFVWVVLMAANFFSPRAIVAHVVWLLVGWGIVLSAVDETTGFSAITRWTLGSLVLVVAAAVISEIVAGRKAIEEQMRREITEKERLQAELEHLANHDPLTGVANRRRFELELGRELARARRQDAGLCVIALDLDGFKEFNDKNGHLAGDRLLKLMASKWTAALRADDLLARTGGDEFVALLPGCSRSEAEAVADRCCRDVPSPGCTCSAGIGVWDGHQTAHELLNRADEALYAVKNLIREPV